MERWKWQQKKPSSLGNKVWIVPKNYEDGIKTIKIFVLIEFNQKKVLRKEINWTLQSS